MSKLRWGAGIVILMCLLAVTAARTQESGARGFVPPTVVSSVAPTFPETAINSGTVVVSVSLDATGEIEKVKILEGSAGFNSAALEAVEKWRFKPATLDGTAIPSTVPVAFSFGWPVACMGGGRR